MASAEPYYIFLFSLLFFLLFLCTESLKHIRLLKNLKNNV